MDLAVKHKSLIEAGLKFHEAYEYRKALRLFQRAYAATPNCVVAQYNLANTLHMLDRDCEAAEILRTLVNTDDSVFLAGCPLGENPRSWKLDALFLLFLVTLYDTRDWKIAYPFAEQHLSMRRRGLHSAWSVSSIRTQIEELRSEFADSDSVA